MAAVAAAVVSGADRSERRDRRASMGERCGHGWGQGQLLELVIANEALYFFPSTRHMSLPVGIRERNSKK